MNANLWSSRWFPIPQHVKNHPEQMRLRASTKQFKVIAAGRRSFKTERFLKREFVYTAVTESNMNIMLGAPTRPQAKLIFWQDIIDLSPKWSIEGRPNKTELSIEYKSGSKLHVVGLKEYQRVEGVLWHKVGITEYQHVDAKFFSQTLQPILNDTGGSGTLEGRPLGKNHFFDDFLRVKAEPERWDSFTWKSSDILTPEQIRSAKSDLAIEDYEREYDASFETGGQRVYYAYSSANNRKHEYNEDLPLIVACDFNATEKPMSWTVGQRTGNITNWMKSLSYKYTNTATMCERLDEHLKTLTNYPNIIIFYGDYAGRKKTSNSSYSDWDLIEKYFGSKSNIEKRIKPTLSVRDRNAATNAQLCNANNERRMFVDFDNCKPLIKDWEYVQRKENGIDLDDSNAELTHNSDSVDYYSDFEFPIRSRGQMIEN